MKIVSLSTLFIVLDGLCVGTGIGSLIEHQGKWLPIGLIVIGSIGAALDILIATKKEGKTCQLKS